MKNARSISAKLSHATRRSFRDAATMIPTEISAQLIARAYEGVNSGEAHKATGGWVASPFYGKGYEIIGLLEIASRAIREAQIKNFRAA